MKNIKEKKIRKGQLVMVYVHYTAYIPLRPFCILTIIHIDPWAASPHRAVESAQTSSRNI